NPRNLISVKHGNLPKYRFTPDVRRQKTGPDQRAKLRQAGPFQGAEEARRPKSLWPSWAQRRVCEAAQGALQRAKEKLSLSSTGPSLHPGNIAGSVPRNRPADAGGSRKMRSAVGKHGTRIRQRAAAKIA